MRRVVVIVAVLVLAGGLASGYQWWEQRQFRKHCESIREDLRDRGKDIFATVDEIGMEEITKCWPAR